MSRSYGPPPEEDDYEDDEDFMFGEDGYDDQYNQTASNEPTFTANNTTITSSINRFGLPPNQRDKDQDQHSRTAPNDTKRRPANTTVKVGRSNVPLPIEDVKMAAMHNNTTVLKQCIEQGYPVDTLIHSDWTAVMYAAHYGNSGAVDCLLQAGASANYHKDMYSVLMAACSSTCRNEDDVISCVNSLVQAGADVCAFDRHHLSPIIYAAREGRAKLIRRLVELGADMNKQDSRGYTALMWAVTRKKLNAVYALIELGCDMNKRERSGSSAIDLATIDGHKQIEQLLRNKGNVDSEKLILTEADLNGAEQKGAGDSSVTAVPYGDLEMVLSGLGLSDLIPRFHKREVTFEQFLRMTNNDLQPIVPQAGVRKRLLDNISKLHKKEWEVTSVSSAGALQTKQVTCAEAIFMMQNIKKHASYIATTVAHIRDNMNAHALSSAQEGAAAEQLLIHSTEARTNAQLLFTELNDLNTHLRTMTSQPEAQPPDLIQTVVAKEESHPRKRIVSICVAGSVVALLVYKRHSVLSEISKLYYGIMN